MSEWIHNHFLLASIITIVSGSLVGVALAIFICYLQVKFGGRE